MNLIVKAMITTVTFLSLTLPLSLWANPLQEGQNFTYADLKTLASQPEVKSIDDFLERLPTWLRSNFTLIHTSSSRQGASYSHPRVLMYNSDGSLIFTFNGHPSQAGYQSLEIAFYNFKTERLRFLELEFKEDRDRVQGMSHYTSMSEIAESLGQNTLSQPNPTACMACHAGEPEKWQTQDHSSRLAVYNWKQYRTWEENFGSTDDFIYQMPGQEGFAYPGQEFKIADAKYDREETDRLKIFRDKAAKLERYQHLIFPDRPFSPYCTPGVHSENNDYRCRKNTMATIFMGLNMLQQFASVKAGLNQSQSIDYLYEAFRCGKSDNLGLELFTGEPLPRLLNPSFFIDAEKHSQPLFRGFWRLGMVSTIFNPPPKSVRRDGHGEFEDYLTSIQAHVPGALLRELAKTHSGFSDLDNLLDIKLHISEDLKNLSSEEYEFPPLFRGMHRLNIRKAQVFGAFNERHKDVEDYGRITSLPLVEAEICSALEKAKSLRTSNGE